MKTLSLLFASWLLVLLGVVAIVASAALALSYCHWEYFDQDVGRTMEDAAALRHTLPLLLLGILGFFSGVHLREMTCHPVFCDRK